MSLNDPASLSPSTANPPGATAPSHPTAAPARIEPVTRADASLLDGLCTLLALTVDGGGSIGFLSPLQHATALAYWQRVFAALGPELHLWVARGEGGEVIGTVQLAPCGKDNGRHRAELQKLMVAPASRGRGVACQLLDAAEARARELGVTLLVLDTEAGSPAEALYQRLGWVKSGEIPDYALTPDGRLHATAYHFKRLG